MSLSCDCEDGDISFAVKVSSEEKYDELVFSIEGVETDSWSIEQDWIEVSYPVTAGTHTFTWTYSKDKSKSVGQDTAWIDAVVLPTRMVYPCRGKSYSCRTSGEQPLSILGPYC